MRRDIFRRWAILMLGLGLAGPAYGATFTVNSSADLVDVDPGNGACDAGGGVCTLRAAVMEANALAGDDTIHFDASLDGVPIILTIPPVDGCPPFGCHFEAVDAAGDLDILENLTIAGNGADKTILQGGASLASSVDRVLEVISPICYDCITTNISGLTIRYGGGPVDHGTGSFEHGGLFASAGALNTIITDSVISNNLGGGINLWAAGSVFLNRVTVSGNTSARGGGMNAGGTFLFITNSTFSGNTADDGAGGGRGGGLAIDQGWVDDDDMAPLIANSTFSGNIAAEGCAIYNSNGFLRLHDVTVAANCVPGSGNAAILTVATPEGVGTTGARNSVIASPAGIVNCGTASTGSFVSKGYNLSTDASCGMAAAGDVESTPALLGPLANNGGATQSHLLLAGSPAIDTGTPLDCPATDQRGLVRPVDGNSDGAAACDKGAVEMAAGPPFSSGSILGTVWDDANGNGLNDGEAGLPTVQICVFPTAPSLCTATAPDGSYFFVGIPAGLYHVYEKLPAGRINTTPRSLAVTVTPGGILSGVDFGLKVIPPPLPTWEWQGPDTYILDQAGSHFLVRANPPCAANAMTATAEFSPIPSIVTHAMSVVNGMWQTSFDFPAGSSGLTAVEVTLAADCTAETFHAVLLFLDPSGTIFDSCTGQPLAGATVTLLKNEPYGEASYVTPDPGEHIPAQNPEVTTADGFYAWDVVPGRWRVQAAKPGYDTVVTDPFDVPPPKLGLDITLTPTAGCNVPPVANDDAYATRKNKPLVVGAPGVLANDLDSDGDALTAVLVHSPGHGSLVLSPHGSFVYQPKPGFVGKDTFTYTATDGAHASGAATVTIDVKRKHDHAHDDDHDDDCKKTGPADKEKS